MQHHQPITDDPVPSHLTGNGVLHLAREHGARAYELGPVLGKHTIRIARGSFVRDFAAEDHGMFRAAPVRAWLGMGVGPLQSMVDQYRADRARGD